MVAGLDMTLQPEAGGESAVLNAQDTGIGNHLCRPPPALICRIANTIALAHSVSERSSPRHHKLLRVIFKELKCYSHFLFEIEPPTYIFRLILYKFYII